MFRIRVSLISLTVSQELSTCTLADFLVANEGKRCVVVLDVSTHDVSMYTGSQALCRKLKRRKTRSIYHRCLCLGSLVRL